jgi:hypothetical protein
METLELLTQLSSNGFQLSLRWPEDIPSNSPILRVSPSHSLTPEFREAIRRNKEALVVVLWKRQSTARSWELGLPGPLLTFAPLIECARRGLVPSLPTKASNVIIENPSEWILKAVDKMGEILSCSPPTKKDLAKMKRALDIFEEMSNWFDEFLWEGIY